VFVLIIRTITGIGYIYGPAKIKKNNAPEYNIIITLTQSKLREQQDDHQAILMNNPLS